MQHGRATSTTLRRRKPDRLRRAKSDEHKRAGWCLRKQREAERKKAGKDRKWEHPLWMTTAEAGDTIAAMSHIKLDFDDDVAEALKQVENLSTSKREYRRLVGLLATEHYKRIRITLENIRENDFTRETIRRVLGIRLTP